MKQHNEDKAPLPPTWKEMYFPEGFKSIYKPIGVGIGNILISGFYLFILAIFFGAFA